MSIQGTGRDTSTRRLQQGVPADVVRVPVGVHDQRDVPGVRTYPSSRLLRVADEPAVNEGRLTPVQQEQVGVGKRPSLPGHPAREPLIIESHGPPSCAAELLDRAPPSGSAGADATMPACERVLLDAVHGCLLSFGAWTELDPQRTRVTPEAARLAARQYIETGGRFRCHD